MENMTLDSSILNVFPQIQFYGVIWNHVAKIIVSICIFSFDRTFIDSNFFGNSTSENPVLVEITLNLFFKYFHYHLPYYSTNAWWSIVNILPAAHRFFLERPDFFAGNQYRYWTLRDDWKAWPTSVHVRWVILIQFVSFFLVKHAVSKRQGKVRIVWLRKFCFRASTKKHISRLKSQNKIWIVRCWSLFDGRQIFKKRPAQFHDSDGSKMVKRSLRQFFVTLFKSEQKSARL